MGRNDKGAKISLSPIPRSIVLTQVFLRLKEQGDTQTKDELVAQVLRKEVLQLGTETQLRAHPGPTTDLPP